MNFQTITSMMRSGRTIGLTSAPNGFDPQLAVGVRNSSTHCIFGGLHFWGLPCGYGLPEIRGEYGETGRAGDPGPDANEHGAQRRTGACRLRNGSCFVGRPRPWPIVRCCAGAGR